MRAGDVIAERFELDTLAQAGGMGSVYRATDRSTGERVAVKVLRSPRGGHEERFLREASLLANLHHPAIVRHIGHGRTPAGELYLAMEWLDGEELGRRIAHGPMSPEDAVTLIRRIAGGLALLHDRGGVHRDLKPSNIYLVGGAVDQAVLLDFGIARAAAALAVTNTGVMIGTPGYTAPEQVRGTRDVNARADVFALGCVLYECLAGAPAFPGEHIMAVLARVLLDEPARLTDVAPETPATLDALIGAMLDKDPTRRPAHARELIHLVDELELDRATSRPPTPRPPTLGTDEQRFMSLVAATELEGAAGANIGAMPTVEGAGNPDDHTLAPDAGTMGERLADVVRRHGGQLERLADGAWVVVAAPTAARGPATDQAALAGRCALALQAALPGARVAIASGRGVSAGRMPVGEVIDRALALLGRVVPGQVATDSLTAGLVGSRFEVNREDDLLVVRRERNELDSDRRVLGRMPPYVGRDRELSMLMSLFDECAGEPTARAVLIRAPAGFGKSRLVRQLHHRLSMRGAGFTWLYARGDPMRVGAPFALAAQLIRRAAGIVEGEPLEERRAKLIDRTQAVPPAEQQRVRAFLGELCDAPMAEEDAQLATARRDAAVMGDQIRRAWDDWLTAEAADKPVVLVLDDLHRGDLPTVKLVNSALRNLRELPLLVLALARPEVDELLPGLWSQRPLTELKLPELSRKASARLVRELLGDDASADVVDRLVAQAGGNAFYLEELCRVAAEEPAQALPSTVLAMAQARLSTLGSAARRVLRAAAVFGDIFPATGVVTLSTGAARGQESGREVEECNQLLAELCDGEVIEARPASRFHGEREFAFRHSLLREAAYATLTDADRALGHRLAAEWFEASGDRDAVLVAEHWLRGGMPERAVAGFLAAAREALEGNDLDAVLERVERGLNAGASGEELGELLWLRAEAHRWRADYIASAESAALALAALPAGRPIWWAAATAAVSVFAATQAFARLDDLLSRAKTAPADADAGVERIRMLAKGAIQLYLLGRYEQGDELCDLADREIHAAGDDPSVRARLHEAQAFREGARAEQGRALELLAAAADAYELAGDLRNAAMGNSNLGYTYMQLGDYAHACALLAEAVRDGERLGLAFVVSVATQNLGRATALGGNLEHGLELERGALAQFREQGDHHMSAVCRIYLAEIHLLAGEAAAAVNEAAQAAPQLSANPPARAMALAVLARARLAIGDGDALTPAREAYTMLESLGGLDEGEMLVRLAYAEALAANGRAEEARALAAVAAERLRRLAERLDDPSLRASYLDAVPENAALLAMAE